MRDSQYLSACEFAGTWLHPSGPAIAPMSLEHITIHGRTRAVYIVCDWGGSIRYVGSTTVGVRNRLRQHLADTQRTARWAEVWIVPLRDDTPIPRVRRIE